MRKLVYLPSAQRFADVALLLLRLFIGLFLIWGVWDNVTSGERMQEFVEFLRTHGFIAPQVLAPVSVYLQLGIGVAFMLGMFTRWAGLICAIHFAIAICHGRLPGRHAGHFPVGLPARDRPVPGDPWRRALSFDEALRANEVPRAAGSVRLKRVNRSGAQRRDQGAYRERRLAGSESGGAGIEGPLEMAQDDTFFNCDNGRLKLRAFSNDAGELIFYRRVNQAGPKESFYIRSPTSSPETLRESLSLAYGQIGRIRKYRTLFLVGRTRVHLDRVEGLGHFLELEVMLVDEESAGTGGSRSQSAHGSARNSARAAHRRRLPGPDAGAGLKPSGAAARHKDKGRKHESTHSGPHHCRGGFRRPARFICGAQLRAERERVAQVEETTPPAQCAHRRARKGARAGCAEHRAASGRIGVDPPVSPRQAVLPGRRYRPPRPDRMPPEHEAWKIDGPPKLPAAVEKMMRRQYAPTTGGSTPISLEEIGLGKEKSNQLIDLLTEQQMAGFSETRNFSDPADMRRHIEQVQRETRGGNRRSHRRRQGQRAQGVPDNRCRRAWKSRCSRNNSRAMMCHSAPSNATSCTTLFIEERTSRSPAEPRARRRYPANS